MARQRPLFSFMRKAMARQKTRLHAPHLVNVPLHPVVQDERDQQRLHVLFWDVEALGDEGDAHARVGLDELEQHLQRVGRASWGGGRGAHARAGWMSLRVSVRAACPLHEHERAQV